MITYGFNTQNIMPIFAMKNGKRKDCPADIDYLECPISLFIPLSLAKEITLGGAQDMIVAAIEEMVAKLNTLTEGEKE